MAVTKLFCVSSRAVRISSRAVRIFQALSRQRVRPSYGTFSLMVFQGNCARGRTGHMIITFIRSHNSGRRPYFLGSTGIYDKGQYISIFRTNCAILLSCIRADPRKCGGFSCVCCHVADQMARATRFSCGFLKRCQGIRQARRTRALVCTFML